MMRAVHEAVYHRGRDRPGWSTGQGEGEGEIPLRWATCRPTPCTPAPRRANQTSLCPSQSGNQPQTCEGDGAVYGSRARLCSGGKNNPLCHLTTAHFWPPQSLAPPLRPAIHRVPSPPIESLLACRLTCFET